MTPIARTTKVLTRRSRKWPLPLARIPPTPEDLDVFLTNTATPAQLKEAAETTAEALKLA